MTHVGGTKGEHGLSLARRIPENSEYTCTYCDALGQASCLVFLSNIFLWFQMWILFFNYSRAMPCPIFMCYLHFHFYLVFIFLKIHNDLQKSMKIFKTIQECFKKQIMNIFKNNRHKNSMNLKFINMFSIFLNIFRHLTTFLQCCWHLKNQAGDSLFPYFYLHFILF